MTQAVASRSHRHLPPFPQPIKNHAKLKKSSFFARKSAVYVSGFSPVSTVFDRL
jgi:hypothetical protein